MNGTLTDVFGIEVGHYTDLKSGTGCTAILVPSGATGGVDVRGSAPGTRETDILKSESSVDLIHGISLSGGSAFGLDAAGGVAAYLANHGIGHKVRSHVIPIVPSAIIFDLGFGKSGIRPGHAEGSIAAQNASTAPVECGTVGAGTGATVGKALGRDHAMKGGLGTSSLDLGGGVVVSALAVVNSVGGIVDPDSGKLLAGPLNNKGEVMDSIAIYSDPGFGIGSDNQKIKGLLQNTTLGVIATNLTLTKPQTNRLATLGHDGFAIAIRPCHTLHDGDTVFSLSTAQIQAEDEVPRLYALAPVVMASAIINAITKATGLNGTKSMSDL